MTPPPPDGSRDRRIEDPSNLFLVHPAARALLPFALRWRVSANAVSLIGLALGTGAGLAYARWQVPAAALLGLTLSVGWLIADGLDGMVARATATASAFGRILDGLVDHGVFVLIYCVIAGSIGTAAGWALAVAAGACHAVQSSLYEGDRARFHRRGRGIAAPPPAPLSRFPLAWLYDTVARSLDGAARPFERALATAADPLAFGQRYAARAVAPMRVMALLTANVRVLAIFLACLAGWPQLFWWFEIAPLSVVLVAGLVWHRRVERACLPASAADPRHTLILQQDHQ